GEPDDVGQADLGAGDLAVAGLVAQMGDDLVDVGHTGGAQRASLGQQPAGDVDRHAPVAPGGTRIDEVAGAARRAQPQVVVVQQLGGGEAVVQLHQVQVFGSDTG